jgi:hypothetical protein
MGRNGRIHGRRRRPAARFSFRNFEPIDGLYEHNRERDALLGAPPDVGDERDTPPSEERQKPDA